MKKMKYLAIMLSVVLLVSGCTSSYISLTEDETNAIAQYSAYLIMKYDENKNVKQKLLDLKDLEEAKKALEVEEPEPSESALESVETITEEVTATPVPTVAPDTIEEPKQQISVDEQPQNEIVEASDIAQQQIAQAISECYGEESFEINYRNYEVCDTYKSVYEYFSISAPDGIKLLILNFDIKNISGETKHFNFSEHKVEFSLLCDDDTELQPRISLLANDLQFLDQDIASGESADAVLLFYIDRIYQSIELQVFGTDQNEQSNTKTYQIKIN